MKQNKAMKNESATHTIKRQTMMAFRHHAGALLRATLLSAALAMFAGCGVVTVHHVPKLGAISGDKMSDLHGSQPIDVRSGECSSEEIKIGTAGVGKVVGNLAEWTAVTVEAAKR